MSTVITTNCDRFNDCPLCNRPMMYMEYLVSIESVGSALECSKCHYYILFKLNRQKAAYSIMNEQYAINNFTFYRDFEQSVLMINNNVKVVDLPDDNIIEVKNKIEKMIIFS